MRASNDAHRDFTNQGRHPKSCKQLARNPKSCREQQESIEPSKSVFFSVGLVALHFGISL